MFNDTNYKWMNWWPIFVIVFYTLAPLPNIIFAQCAEPSTSESFLDTRARSWKDTGFFLTGILIFSGLGLPIVLYHSDVIALGQLLLALGGGVITYAAFVIYIHFFLLCVPVRTLHCSVSTISGKAGFVGHDKMDNISVASLLKH